MAKDPAFDVVAQLRTDEADLVTGMRRAEKVVEQSSRRMESSLNRATLSTEKLQQGVAAIGATASLAGSQIGTFASAAAGAAGALRAVFASVSALTAGIIGAAAVIIGFRKEIAAWAIAQTELGQAIEESNKSLDRFLARAKETREARLVGQDVTALEDRRLLALDKITEAELRLRDAERAERKGDPFAKRKAEIANEIAVIEERKARAAKAQEQAAQAKLELDKRNLQISQNVTRELASRMAMQRSVEVALARQLAIRIGLAKQSDFARSAAERDLLLFREKLDAERGSAGSVSKAGGFSIGAADVRAFRFGAINGPTAFIGQQKTEQRQTTRAIEIGNEQRAQLLAIVQRRGLDDVVPGTTRGGMGR